MSIRDKVKPEDFRIDVHYFGTFDNDETETSARLLVRYLQERGNGWEPFSKNDLDTWNKKRCPSDPSFHLQRLTGYWNGNYSPLVVTGDRVVIQDAFIARVCSNSELVK